MKNFRFSARAAIVCSLILAIGVPSVAMGFGEGRNLLLGKRNPSSNPARAQHRDRDHRQQHDLRHPPVQQEGRRRRRRDLRLPLQPGQRALHPRQQPQGRPRVRVRHRRQGSRPHRDRRRPTGAPFTTNATGVATGLNADQVDGKDATDFAAAADLAVARASSADSGTCAAAAVGGRRPDDRVTATTAATSNVYTVDFKQRRLASAPTPPRRSARAADQAPGVAPARPAERRSPSTWQRRRDAAADAWLVPRAGDLLSCDALSRAPAPPHPPERTPARAARAARASSG